MSKKAKQVTVYTDGGMFEKNPGPGGYAAIILKDGKVETELTGSFSMTTNNRMEASAVVHALEHLERRGVKDVVIYSDSQYVVNSVNHWIHSWVRKPDFGNKKNEDIWRTVLKLKKKFKRVRMVWVKGHNGDKWNEYADELAGEAARNIDAYEEDLGYLASIGKEPSKPVIESSTKEIRYSGYEFEAQMIQRKLRKMPKNEWNRFFVKNGLSQKKFTEQTGIKIISVNLTNNVSGI